MSLLVQAELIQNNVSRETIDKLQILADLLKKWNPKINLVSKSTIDNLWTRHILDSAQLFNLKSHPLNHWVDIGSGGGFPGLIIALMADEKKSPAKVTLIESDQRKCAFLRTVLRETGTKGTVLAQRIEDVGRQNADVLSARALADMDALLNFAELHLAADGIALFPKGVTWKKELLKAQQSWSFSCDVITSKTESEAVILKVGDIRRV